MVHLPKKFLWGAVFLMALLFIGWWWRYMSGPAVGVVTVGSPSETSVQATTPPKEYAGKYFRFSHRGDYEPYFRTPEGRYPVLERQWLIQEAIRGRKIAVVVQALEGLDLKEESAYRLRSYDSATYTQSSRVVQGKRFTLFEKRTPVYEVGAFWEKQGMGMSIVLTSSTEFEPLMEELIKILESLSYIRG